MTKVFLIADTHFFHGNIIKYCNRPFSSVEEMNNILIEKWNSVVKEDDIVIHLGDFAFKGRGKEIRNRLNGTIILIRGNHDYNLKEDDGFIIIEGNMIIGNFILTHRPLPIEEIPRGMINVFGHIHHNKAYSGECVSVEQTDYSPVEILQVQGYKVGREI